VDGSGLPRKIQGLDYQYEIRPRLMWLILVHEVVVTRNDLWMATWVDSWELHRGLHQLDSTQHPSYNSILVKKICINSQVQMCIKK
jgi:hypothetical protein